MPVQKETIPSTTEKAIDDNNDSWEVTPLINILILPVGLR